MKGYRTLALNVTSALIGVLLATDWVSFGLSSEEAGMVLMGLGVANTVLRFFTNSPVGKK